MKCPIYIISRKQNTSPSVIVPATQSVAWSSSLTFSGTLSIVDVDSNPQTITITVSHGTVALSSTSGLTGSGNGTASLSYSGSLTAINAALNGAAYTPSSTYAGSDTMTITANDGSAGDSDNIIINVVRPAGLTYLKMTSSTVFQTSAGSTPSGTGDPVGKLLNSGSSGVANALQSSSGLRPTVSTDVPSVFTASNERSLLFDGSDDALAIADNAALSGMSQLTIVAWAKGLTVSSGLQRLYDKSFSAAYQSNMGSATGFLGGFNATNVTAPVTSVLNWNHYIFQYDGSFITGYGNNTAGTPTAKTGTIVTTAGDLYIGNRNGGGRTLNGYLKDLWIWPGILSATQRAYLLAGGA